MRERPSHSTPYKRKKKKEEKDGEKENCVLMSRAYKKRGRENTFVRNHGQVMKMEFSVSNEEKHKANAHELLCKENSCKSS